ncbi:MAG: 4-hydroxy-tetrahydrodipicolinate reductase [Eubacteriales bacterium]|nr:4-hydroxy-tetrahydrodipicolinate reductase [Eubacteriales bacterium]
MAVKIILNGCCGRMGQAITRLSEGRADVEIIAGIDICDNGKCPYKVYTSAAAAFENTEKADVLLDFSNPGALDALAGQAASSGLPLVVATTGLSDKQKVLLRTISSQIPVFFSANMSLGINLLISLLRKATPVLKDSFDIEIIEKHHNRKIDAPSGTALAIADAVKDSSGCELEYIYERQSKRAARSCSEIGIHSIRGGTIAGEHTVIFAGNDETLEITHRASSRDIFAEGALKAAVFMAGKAPGFYGMEDLIKTG